MRQSATPVPPPAGLRLGHPSRDAHDELLRRPRPPRRDLAPVSEDDFELGSMGLFARLGAWKIHLGGFCQWGVPSPKFEVGAVAAPSCLADASRCWPSLPPGRRACRPPRSLLTLNYCITVGIWDRARSTLATQHTSFVGMRGVLEHPRHAALVALIPALAWTHFDPVPPRVSAGMARAGRSCRVVTENHPESRRTTVQRPLKTTRSRS